MHQTSVAKAFEACKRERVVFVIAQKSDSHPTGMAAAWNMKCSFNPAMFCVAVSRDAFTHTVIRKQKEFVIAVANKKLLKTLQYFGSISGKKVDKFTHTGIETMPAKFVKPPLVKNATVNFECKLVATVRTGDHTVFVGKILAAYANPKSKVLLTVKTFRGKRYFKEL